MKRGELEAANGRVAGRELCRAPQIGRPESYKASLATTELAAHRPRVPTRVLAGGDFFWRASR